MTTISLFKIVDMVGPDKSLFVGPNASSKRVILLLGRLLGLLGQEHGLDVGQNTSLGNGDAREQLVQLLVVTDRQLQVAGNDPALLVVTGSVSRQLEHLGCEVLHNSGQVHGGTGANSLGVVAFPQMPVDTAHWELKPGTRAPGLALSLRLSSFSASRHDDAARCVPFDCLQSTECSAVRRRAIYTAERAVLVTAALLACDVINRHRQRR